MKLTPTQKQLRRWAARDGGLVVAAIANNSQVVKTRWSIRPIQETARSAATYVFRAHPELRA